MVISLLNSVIIEAISDNISIPLLKLNPRLVTPTPYIAYDIPRNNENALVILWDGSHYEPLIEVVDQLEGDYAILIYRKVSVSKIIYTSSMNVVNEAVNATIEAVAYHITHKSLMKNSAKYKRYYKKYKRRHSTRC